MCEFSQPRLWTSRELQTYRGQTEYQSPGESADTAILPLHMPTPWELLKHWPQNGTRKSILQEIKLTFKSICSQSRKHCNLISQPSDCVRILWAFVKCVSFIMN